MSNPMTALVFLSPKPRKGRVIVLVRPTKPVPKWWPRNDKQPAWATLDFNPRDGYCGYSVGRWPEMAISAKWITAALIEHVNAGLNARGNPSRRWEVKLEKKTRA